MGVALRMGGGPFRCAIGEFMAASVARPSGVDGFLEDALQGFRDLVGLEVIEVDTELYPLVIVVHRRGAFAVQVHSPNPDSWYLRHQTPNPVRTQAGSIVRAFELHEVRSPYAQDCTIGSHLFR